MHDQEGILAYLSSKRRIRCCNTSGEATCDELFVKKTIHVMKKAMILGSALSIVGLMLVSCSSEPESTTTTTRQTTVTTAAPPPTGTTTTTTTHHMGGGY
jgi:hypothetical protein